jgi:hypothetical protein
VQGKGPPGEYKWFVHYYGGLGGYASATRWKVRIKHDNKVTVIQGKLGTIGERSRVYTLTVEPGGRPGRPGAAGPPADISDWKTFSSPEGAFTVSIPEIPAGRKQAVKTPLGDLDEYRYALEAGDGTYTVAYLDYPAALMQGKDPLTLLDDSSGGLVAAAQGQQQDVRRNRAERPARPRGPVRTARRGRHPGTALPGQGPPLPGLGGGTPDFATSPEAHAFLRRSTSSCRSEVGADGVGAPCGHRRRPDVAGVPGPPLPRER